MDSDLELLKFIYQSSKIGIANLKELNELLEGKQNIIKKSLKDILIEYENYEKNSKGMLNKKNEKAKSSKFISKSLAKVEIKKEVKKDNSDSAIAHLLIERLTIVIIEMESKISKHEKEVEKKTMKISKEYLKFNKQLVEKYKEYL